MQCRILRESISIATKTYNIRNVAVTVTKKSQATIRLRVIAHECGPTLIRTAARSIFTQILPYSSRRDAEAQLELELVGDAFLAPSWVIPGDLLDHFLEILRQRRTTLSSRLPAPPSTERGPMPFEERVWLDDYQGVAPSEEPGQREHSKPKGPRRSRRFGLPLPQQRELFAKE